MKKLWHKNRYRLFIIMTLWMYVITAENSKMDYAIWSSLGTLLISSHILCDEMEERKKEKGIGYIKALRVVLFIFFLLWWVIKLLMPMKF